MIGLGVGKIHASSELDLAASIFWMNSALRMTDQVIWGMTSGSNYRTKVT